MLPHPSRHPGMLPAQQVLSPRGSAGRCLSLSSPLDLSHSTLSLPHTPPHRRYFYSHALWEQMPSRKRALWQTSPVITLQHFALSTSTSPHTATITTNTDSMFQTQRARVYPAQVWTQPPDPFLQRSSGAASGGLCAQAHGLQATPLRSLPWAPPARPRPSVLSPQKGTGAALAFLLPPRRTCSSVAVIIQDY